LLLKQVKIATRSSYDNCVDFVKVEFLLVSTRTTYDKNVVTKSKRLLPAQILRQSFMKLSLLKTPSSYDNFVAAKKLSIYKVI